MDATMLGIVIAVLAVVLASLMWFKSRGNGGGQQTQRRVPAPVNQEGGGAQMAGGRRRMGGRMRRGGAQEAAQAAEIAAEEEELEREELEEAGVKVPDGKIGKKKLEKLQLKAEKKAQREAEEREREENKKRKEELDEEDRKRREREAEEERREEEEEERRKAEKARKEHEEYLALKAAFSVEEEGFDEEEAGDGSEENKLKKFVDYIQATKVVVLEDLAAHFKMKTQDTIDRVTQLQADGMLSGVIDDRDKFIYISEKELEDVAKFIRQRGRVSLADLAESSNKLINLTPETVKA